MDADGRRVPGAGLAAPAQSRDVSLHPVATQSAHDWSFSFNPAAQRPALLRNTPWSQDSGCGCGHRAVAGWDRDIERPNSESSRTGLHRVRAGRCKIGFKGQIATLSTVALQHLRASDLFVG